MISVIFVAGLILLDQLVKIWALRVLAPVGTIPLIDGIFQLRYIENRGAAFSMLQNQTLPLIIVSVIVVAAIIFAFQRNMLRTTLGRFSLLLVVSGAIGNLIDRIFRGFVVDLFDFVLIHFPVFNVADIFIVVGGILFVFYFMFQHDKAV